MPYSPSKFAEKYHLALSSAREENPSGGLHGFELEWNLLDEQFRPLLTVGTGPAQQSFVDYLRAECLPLYLADFSQLEVFHWMIEWATRPYYSPRGAAYEGRLMEAVLMNALARAGANFSERLFHWHGNLIALTAIGRDSIPGSWGLAKRRYLERCVDLYGDTLATAGTHSNLSLPDPLFQWDFMHLGNTERGERHLDEFKSEFYITATRLLRAFAGLFIATSASTPLQAEVRNGRPAVILTENDSVRNLTFPNPAEIDLPDLYRSYEDYLQISFDLVRRGVRFGNNNWTPVRARSFAQPVERLISTTSDQLSDLYARGLYSVGEAAPAEEMARQIEKQNLMARINLPMGRVEVRTDDGGNPLELEIANMSLKQLLLLRFYADPGFARSFRYDREDITRARANERLAAQDGLRAEIENPLTGKPVAMRAFLAWTLGELRPLAEALGMWDSMNPLVEMSQGAPNTSERLRASLRKEVGQGDEVPAGLLREMAIEREAQVRADVDGIAAQYATLDGDAEKIGEMLQQAREDAQKHPELPVRFRPTSGIIIETRYPDKTTEILDLAQHLIRIPSVTASPNERLMEVHRAATFIFDYLRGNGFEPRYFDAKYPAVYTAFPQAAAHQSHSAREAATILLSGHFDVVEPEPDDSQFAPRIEGDYLWGRGAADMKTVVATYLVWMKDVLRGRNGSFSDKEEAGGPGEGRPSGYPNISLLLVGNEENGEAEPWGTPHVLHELGQVDHSGNGVSGRPDETGLPYTPALLIAGERTGEKGDELFGEICVENRGVARFEVIARGTKGHSGVAGSSDLTETLVRVRDSLAEIFADCLTLTSADGWHSQARFPFVSVGTPGVYNITPSEGILGVEVRSIPQDDLSSLRAAVAGYCADNELEVRFSVVEDGVACDPENAALKLLIEAVRRASGAEPKIGRKLPGTSARFAPGGQAVVWGQSGLGPHSKDERHYIPSIEPYYRALTELAGVTK
jgi:acetylornithine deacetylase/succinyl-diaminopimelate desuccinylase-like protein/gamma-glutamyl:cysteine ligase YbdK (ATP-grasp superfamily)